MSVERFLLATLLAALVVVLLLLMLRSWRRRGSRDGMLGAYPMPEAPAAAQATARVAYVATTRHELPLERLFLRGLRFRAQGTLRVARDGITVELAGNDPRFVPAAALHSVGEASWVIDRAVERDGLLRVSWRMHGTRESDAHSDAVADSFFRVIDPAERAALVSAITPILPAATAAGANSEAGK